MPGMGHGRRLPVSRAIDPFTFETGHARIVFGASGLDRIAVEVQALACRRALVLCTPSFRGVAEAITLRLGSLASGIFDGAAMHTPVEVTERALIAFRDTGADCVVAFGGGSTVGLAKAIAWRTDAPQIVVATTYAGSEVTPILGQTENGLKTTLRDRKVLPEVVIYDPELTTGLPVSISVTSGLNAMAHAVEGLYARDRNPVSTWMAAEGLRSFAASLPAIVETPGDLAARQTALFGAWLCGSVLGTVGMALHHKLCHALGGTFRLPHAETHAVLLPHTVAYNAEAAGEQLRPVADLFGAATGSGLQDFASTLGAPTALRDLGLRESDLDRACDVAIQNPYWNPRPVERGGIRGLLRRAWAGDSPEA